MKTQMVYTEAEAKKAFEEYERRMQEKSAMQVKPV